MTRSHHSHLPNRWGHLAKRLAPALPLEFLAEGELVLKKEVLELKKEVLELEKEVQVLETQQA